MMLTHDIAHLGETKEAFMVSFSIIVMPASSSLCVSVGLVACFAFIFFTHSPEAQISEVQTSWNCNI